MYVSDDSVDTGASSAFALALEQRECRQTLEAGGCRDAWSLGLGPQTTLPPLLPPFWPQESLWWQDPGFLVELVSFVGFTSPPGVWTANYRRRCCLCCAHLTKELNSGLVT